MLNKNFWDRIRRQQEKLLKTEAQREQEIGECTNCGNAYFWSQLTDLSTQEYYKVLCEKCIRLQQG